MFRNLRYCDEKDPNRQRRIHNNRKKYEDWKEEESDTRLEEAHNRGGIIEERRESNRILKEDKENLPG